jgi:hypothetical protein
MARVSHEQHREAVIAEAARRGVLILRLEGGGYHLWSDKVSIRTADLLHVKLNELGPLLTVRKR